MRRHAWTIAAVGLVLLVSLALRYGTPVRTHGAMYDEDEIRLPIDDIIARGWSVATAIDYEETKGPAMIWPYALLAGSAEDTLDAMRLVSAGCFVLGVFPVLAIARRMGLQGPALLGVAALYALLPYHATLGQLVMSEASFVLGGLVLWWVALRGLATGRAAWLVAYMLLLVVLMHHRVHAVAYAGAVCMLAWERDGRASWPWWLASIVAGLLRVPLWLRWGGLVSPAYQGMFGLGVSPDAVVYLMAAMALLTTVFIVPLLTARDRPGLLLVAIVAALAFVLALVFAPELTQTVDRLGRPTDRFAGILRSAVQRAVPGAASVVIALTAAAGSGGLAALALAAWRRDARSDEGAVLRALVWTLAIGAGLYLLTHSMVFDRYLLVWAILAPTAWVRVLPRWACAAQGALLLVAALQIGMWLVDGPKQPRGAGAVAGAGAVTDAVTRARPPTVAPPAFPFNSHFLPVKSPSRPILPFTAHARHRRAVERPARAAGSDGRVGRERARAGMERESNGS